MNGPVLLTGGGGQLGRAVTRAFADLGVVAPPRSELDVRDRRAVARIVAALRPALVINCAAWNDVDGAEDAAVAALEANAFAVASLARAVDDIGSVLVHYSSDFVFDGTASTPYTEEDAPNPRSVYAASKLLGDWLALESPRAYVLRVESLFGVPADTGTRRGSLDRMLDVLQRGEEVPVFTDRTVSPSHVDDVAGATRALVAHGATPGLYHCVNSGRATWEAVAIEAARLLNVTPRLRRITLEQVRMRAPRPRFCALSNAKLAAAGIVMPRWEEALARAVSVVARRSDARASRVVERWP